MLSLALAVAVAHGFNDYPGFVRPQSRIEATIDRGPIVEMIVKCRGGTAIVTYSKMEKVYCTPRLACGARLSRVLAETCG